MITTYLTGQYYLIASLYLSTYLLALRASPLGMDQLFCFVLAYLWGQQNSDPCVRILRAMVIQEK